MENIFLSIDGIVIEDLEEENYKAYEKGLGQYLRMIAGNMVYEERGTVWVIEVNFADIDAAALKTLTAAMAGSATHQIAFLPSNGDTTLTTGEFFLTERAAPSLRSWLNPVPEWSGYAMTFEEVRPHD